MHKLKKTWPLFKAKRVFNSVTNFARPRFKGRLLFEEGKLAYEARRCGTFISVLLGFQACETPRR